MQSQNFNHVTSCPYLPGTLGEYRASLIHQPLPVHFLCAPPPGLIPLIIIEVVGSTRDGQDNNY